MENFRNLSSINWALAIAVFGFGLSTPANAANEDLGGISISQHSAPRSSIPVAVSAPPAATPSDTPLSDTPFLTAQIRPTNININVEGLEIDASGNLIRTPDGKSGSSITGAAVGGSVGGVVGLGLIIWWFWPGIGEASFVEFKHMDGDNYLPARSWVGIEQNLTQEVKFSLGGFWLQGEGNDISSFVPSEDNLGGEFNMAYQTRSAGDFSLNTAFYYQGNASNSSDGINNDYYAYLSDRGTNFDTRIGLRWKAAW